MRINSVVVSVISGVVGLSAFSVQAWMVSDRLSEDSGIVEIESTPESEHIRNTFRELISANDSIRTETLNLQGVKKDSDPALKKTPSPDNIGVVFERNQSALSIDEEVNLDYHQANDCLARGEDKEAEVLFLNILAKKPLDDTARISLVNLYLKANRDEDAEKVLQKGLSQKKNHPEYLRLLSLVYERCGDSEKALTTLFKMPDPYKETKEYIAFLGHLYQQAGQFSLARQQYFKLLKAEPKNALWMLGSAIALDSEGQKKAALEGYQRLKDQGELEPALLRYVQERIRSLKGPTRG